MPHTMPEVRLGKILIRHCPRCRVPVLAQRSCSACGTPTRAVQCTPPGDVRPASPADLGLAADMIERQYGPGCFGALCAGAPFALMNSAPALDRLDELIMDGEVLGALSFDHRDGRWAFLPRAGGARRMLSQVTRGWVVADDGALKPIAEGGSLLAVGVPEASGGIRAGDEVLVLSSGGRLVGVGRARMDGPDMVEAGRDMAVKIRVKTGILPNGGGEEDEHDDTGPGGRAGIWRRPARAGGAGENDHRPSPGIDEVMAGMNTPGAWETALRASAKEMDHRVRRAKAFVKRVSRERDLPVVVSFSGGKDSLACLILVTEAGLSPTMLFMDTGLEFPSTVEHVKRTAEAFGTPLITAHAGDAFWKGLPYFGPPGRDYRWCCKTCKLGPASRTIAERFPDGMLSFIGQRSYESIQRARKSAVWENPWVKGQVGASPIQDWTALHVWLLIRSRGVEYNELYDMGFARIGCFPCPATSMAEHDIMDRALERGENWVPPELKRFREALEESASGRGLPSRWWEVGLWRWRSPPRSQTELFPDLASGPDGGVSDEGAGRGPPRDDAGGHEGPAGPMAFKTAGGFADCAAGLSAEGAFDRALPVDKVTMWLHVLGPVELDGASGELRCAGGRLSVFPEGALVARGRDEGEVRGILEKGRDVIFRAAECVGCGSCTSRCPSGALAVDDTAGVAVIDTSACTHCGKCLGPCPVTGYRTEEEFQL